MKPRFVSITKRTRHLPNRPGRLFFELANTKAKKEKMKKILWLPRKRPRAPGLQEGGPRAPEGFRPAGGRAKRSRPPGKEHPGQGSQIFLIFFIFLIFLVFLPFRKKSKKSIKYFFFAFFDFFRKGKKMKKINKIIFFCFFWFFSKRQKKPKK